MAGQRNQLTGVEFEEAAYLKALNARFKKLVGATENDVRATGHFVVNKAKGYAAVKTGFMRSNITMEEANDSKGFHVRIVCRAAYWIHIEFGAPAANVPAQPFMRPAFAEGKQYFVDRVTRRGQGT